MPTIKQEVTEQYAIYNADCIELTREIPDESIGLSIFSPPFASLYTYSNSSRDMGNCKTDDEFMENFGFLVDELYRITQAGRIVAFHCMNLPASKERDGYIGIKDFRGDLIRCFQKRGFIYHSEHVIWKDPLVAATRTKALGLLHKQLCKDSAMCRAGIPDYLIAMRKPGENPVPISHVNGLETFYGENPPTEGVLSHQRWQRYASPVWMDIDPSYTLQAESLRNDKDERHVCPLQIQVIERALELWSKKGDTVLSPFMGIGSETVTAVKMGRNAIGIELKEEYYDQAARNMKKAVEDTHKQMTFDFGGNESKGSEK